MKFAPLYDNGSSLCAYVEEKEIELILRDRIRFEALINIKSKSAIGCNNIRPVRQFELIQYIKDKYYNKTVNFIKKINDNINEIKIDEILKNYNEEIISNDRKVLLKKFLLDRKRRFIEIYVLEAK